MKKFLSVLVLVAMAFLFSACSKNESNETVNIGVLGPFSGNLASYGESVRKGVELAVEEINTAGGILGKQVKIYAEDDEGDAQKALNAYNKITDEIDFLIGEVVSAISEVIGAEAQKDGLPMLAPCSTAANITKNRSYVFRACFLDPDQGITMANFAKETLKIAKVAVVYDNSDDYSSGVAEAFKTQAEKNGIEVVFFDGGIVAKSADFKAIASKIASSTAEAVFAPIYYGDVATFVRDVRIAGYKKPLMGADGWDGTSAVLLGEDGKGDVSPLNNCYFSNHYASDATNAKIFVAAYEKKYGTTPNSFAALAYDSMYIVKAAMEKAQTTERNQVSKALATVTYSGVTGNYVFNETGDPKKNIVICEYINGVITFKESK